jgi:ACS family glucarate transporter-like MFS transporter
MLFVATIINYGGRSVLSTAAPLLKQDLHIDNLQLGWIFSAFGWAYVIAQIPGGWLLDRYGSMRVYHWSIILWSAMTAVQGLLPWMAGLSAVSLLFGLRFLVGLAEAPVFPGNARVVAAWFPAAGRGTASAIFNAAQYFATVLFAPLLGWIAYTWGWPAAFWFMGGIGLVAAAVWPRFMHDPSRHPRLGVEERQLIATGGGIVDIDRAPKRPSVPWSRARILLRDRTAIGLYIGQYAITKLTYFFITWFPVYLVQQRGLSVLQAGAFATVPALCGFTGGVLGGMWSDGLLRRGWSLTRARKLPIIVGMLFSILILGCNYVDRPWLVMLFMSLAYFGKGVGALGWAVLSDISPRETAGLAGGIFNTFGNLASIVTPIAVGALVQATGNFDSALVFVAANALLAVASFLFIVGEIRRIELPTEFSVSAIPSSAGGSS